MRYAFHSLRLGLFDRVVEEKIDQYSVQMGFRMLPSNLPLQELDAPDATSSELDLPGIAAFYNLVLFNMGL